MPRSRCRSTSRRRICAWIVTSSAVVGSSAISSAGPHISAMAIMTRWRNPPESWCGYWPSRSAGAVMPTFSSSSTARSRAAARDEPAVAAVHLGELVADGVGRIERRHRLLEHHRHAVAAQLGQTRGGQAAQAPRPGTPAGAPGALRPAAAGPSARSAVIDLPQPDSPTRHSVSPRSMRKRDVAHGMQRAARGRDIDAEPLDIEQRAAHVSPARRAP